jgi:hypothetical protein
VQNKGLLFIPDISGFTRFINETEIQHSRLIMQELLETLIDANQLGLEVSEIEGDAILFYKFGESPTLEDLYRQVKKMFCVFHSHIIAYDNRRFCQCVACTSAVNLTLKIITHYGEFTGYTVRNFNKLIGKDVIVAHQLLKNDIQQHEYWLVTQHLLKDKDPVDFTEWMKWKSSAKQTEVGDISFHYTHLGNLKGEIVPGLFPLLNLSKRSKLISLTHEYNTDIITLFHATGDFQYRSRWLEGVRKVDEVSHFLPRVGTRCRCILDTGEDMIYSSSYTYQPDKIEFSETEEMKNNITYYTLEKLSAKRTKLTIDYYPSTKAATSLLFILGKKKKMIKSLQKSLRNLEGLVRQIKLPGREQG